jgi:hypothetical protein
MRRRPARDMSADSRRGAFLARLTTHCTRLGLTTNGATDRLQPAGTRPSLVLLMITQRECAGAWQFRPRSASRLRRTPGRVWPHSTTGASGETRLTAAVGRQALDCPANAAAFSRSASFRAHCGVHGELRRLRQTRPTAGAGRSRLVLVHRRRRFAFRLVDNSRRKTALRPSRVWRRSGSSSTLIASLPATGARSGSTRTFG